jgi:hypothetical protein
MEVATVDLEPGNSGITEVDQFSESLDEKIGSLRNDAERDYFKTLEMERKILADNSRAGLCFRCCLCIFKQLSKVIFMLNLMVPVIFACATQFYTSLNYSDLQKGLWVGLGWGGLICLLIWGVSRICIHYASIVEPLSKKRIFLETSRWGIVYFICNLIMFVGACIFLASIEKHCTNPQVKCTLKQIVTNGLLN